MFSKSNLRKSIQLNCSIGLCSSLLLLGNISCKKDDVDYGNDLQSNTSTGVHNSFKAIYLHWTAGNYDCNGDVAYHTKIKKSGEVIRQQYLRDREGIRKTYDMGNTGHTALRNSGSVAIALCCMAGTPTDEWSNPCSQAQFTAMAKEVALIAKTYNWSIEDITAKPKDSINGRRVMTHAEAAASWDYPKDKVVQAGSDGDGPAKRLGLKHDNYGPRQWDILFKWPGSTRGELRWDLAQLEEKDKMGSGGDILRGKIRAEMLEMQGGSTAQNSTVTQNGTEPVIVKPDIVKPDIVKPDIVKLDICDEIANEK